MEKLFNESEIPPIKAGDIRVLINGEPPRADIRLLSEENYQKALSLEKLNTEMLEALKLLTSEYEEFDGDILLKTYEKVKALIKRAEGGTP